MIIYILVFRIYRNFSMNLPNKFWNSRSPAKTWILWYDDPLMWLWIRLDPQNINWLSDRAVYLVLILNVFIVHFGKIRLIGYQYSAKCSSSDLLFFLTTYDSTKPLPMFDQPNFFLYESGTHRVIQNEQFCWSSEAVESLFIFNIKWGEQELRFPPKPSISIYCMPPGLPPIRKKKITKNLWPYHIGI